MAVKTLQDVAPYAVNFSVVVVLLAVILRKPTRKFIYQRHERMKDSFESAARIFDGAKNRFQLSKQKIDTVEHEETLILRREKEFADTEKSEILKKAEEEVGRLLREADRLASTEVSDAAGLVRSKFIQLVVEKTEDSLRSNLKKDDHLDLVKRAQGSIEVGV